MAANGRIPTSNLSALPKSWSNKGEVEHLRRDAYESLSRALNRAVAESGQNFQIWDAYRSLSEQVSMLKRNYYAVSGGRRPGDRSYNGTTYRRRSGRPATASPGYSNHGTGLAIDVHPGGIQNWFKTKGRAYGWTWDEGRRLGESWHFVYNPALDGMKSEGELDHAWVQKVVGASVDGKIGTGTVAKIKEWQTANGLTADGKVGSGTKSAMQGKIPAPSVSAGNAAQAAKPDTATIKAADFTLNTDHTAINFNSVREYAGEPLHITIHWWGKPVGQSHDGIVNWFTKDKNVPTSAHYIVSPGLVHRIVDEDHVSWANGNRKSNHESITLELNPDPSKIDDMIATVGSLVRDIRSRHGDLPLVPHSNWVATQCPGHFSDRLDDIDAVARDGSVTVISGGTSRPDSGKLTEDGRWGRKTSEEIQTRLGVLADGRMGPDSWTAMQNVYGTPADGTVSRQSYKHDELGNGISPNGWDYTGRGSSGSTLIEKLQADVGATPDGILYEGTTRLVQRKLNNDPNFLKSVAVAEVDGRFGRDTVKAAQRFLNNRGNNLTVDGKAGHNFWKALQSYLGTPVDGKVSNQSFKASELGNGITQGWEYTGPGSKGSSMVRALQKWVGVTQDGVWGEGTTAAFQRKLLVHGESL